MVLDGEKVSICEILVDRTRLLELSEFKYLECVLDETGGSDAGCCRKVTSGRKVASAVRSLMKAKGLQFEHTRVLHEALFVPILLYGSETVILPEKERLCRWIALEVCWVLGETLNARIRKLC